MHSSIDSSADFGRAAREIVSRSVAAVGLAGIALIHLLDALGKFHETPYMGWMYVGLIISCLVLAATLLHTSAREAWLATIVLAGSAIAGFTLTRTVGLPQARGDIGNWSEPLGLASLFVEGTVIAISGYVLALLSPARAFARGGRVAFAGAR